MKPPRITPAEAAVIEQAMTTAVRELFDTFFPASRSVRSSAYKAGVRAKLSHGMDGLGIVCPYAQGTAEFDAFHAGIDEGRAILRALA